MRAGAGSARRGAGWRWGVRVAISLLAGAAMSILVAWWVCFNGTNRFFHIPLAWQWPELMGWRQEMRGDVGIGMTINAASLASVASVRIGHGPPDVSGDRSVLEQTAASMGMQVIECDQVPGWAEPLVARHVRDLPSGKRALLTVQMQGWPTPCMRSWSWNIGDRRGSKTTVGPVAQVPAFLQQALGSSTNVLPITPVPGRFLACTLFWATPWLLGLSAFAEGRRWQRRRLGRCLACGYHLAGLDGGAKCPECGAGARSDTA